jgi:hypothetical protein
MNELKDFLNSTNPVISILIAVVILLVLGGICLLLEPLLVALSYVFLGIGVLLALIWIIKSIINIFK